MVKRPGAGRVRWVAFAAGLLLPLFFSCPGYSPTLVDCSVHCGPQQSCPSGYACKANWCRPVGVGGACDCKPGDSRACGGGKGLCVPGIQTCTTSGTWGTCVGEGKPSAEVCDGLDNDCDGVADNDLSDQPVCPLRLGVCAGTAQVCASGAYQGFCDATTYGPNFQTVESKCDGLDNDCDGITDGTATVPLLSNVVAYDLEEVDSGYVVAAYQFFIGDGGYGLMLMQLDPYLHQTAPPLFVPGSPSGDSQYVKATSYQGVAYVTYANPNDDSDVNLLALDPDGGLRSFKTVSPSGLNGPLTVGVDGTRVAVVYRADAGTQARMVSWNLSNPNAYTISSASGPYSPYITVSSAAISPHAAGVVWTGDDNDSGSSLYYASELGGARTGNPPVYGNYALDDTGATLHAAWNENVNFSFFGITENYSQTLYKPDLYSSSYGSTVRQFGDYTVIQFTNMGHGVSGPALVWTEYNARVAVGTPIGAGAQTRLRFFTPDAGTATAGYPDIAYCGLGDMMAVTYLDGVVGIGNLYGQLVCPP